MAKCRPTASIVFCPSKFLTGFKKSGSVFSEWYVKYVLFNIKLKTPKAVIVFA